MESNISQTYKGVVLFSLLVKNNCRKHELPFRRSISSEPADSGAKLPPFRAKVATVPADGCRHSGAKLPLFEGVAE
jgi:hypothetical protein